MSYSLLVLEDATFTRDLAYLALPGAGYGVSALSDPASGLQQPARYVQDPAIVRTAGLPVLTALDGHRVISFSPRHFRSVPHDTTVIVHQARPTATVLTWSMCQEIESEPETPRSVLTARGLESVLAVEHPERSRSRRQPALVAAV